MQIEMLYNQVQINIKKNIIKIKMQKSDDWITLLKFEQHVGVFKSI